MQKKLSLYLTLIFFAYHLEQDDPALKKYTDEYVLDINYQYKEMINRALEKGINDKSIPNSAIDEIGFYREYILQSLFSLKMRITLKEHERKSFNITLLNKQIEVIIFYLGAGSSSL